MEKSPHTLNKSSFDRPLSFPEPTSLWRHWKALEGFNGKTITEQDVPVRDLTGAWIIVSGANSGIGAQAALYFAKCGANLVLACRVHPGEEHPDFVVNECKLAARSAGHEKSTIEWWEIDMSKLNTVEAFAKRWLATCRPLNILCNNAGMSARGLANIITTGDGFEIVHQVNFLSHVLITMRLLPSLARARAPRIVCTTSNMTYLGKYDLNNFNGAGCRGIQLYKNNKLYFQVWLTELQQRFIQSEQYRHITINGVHPGLVKSSIWATHTNLRVFSVINTICRFLLQLLVANFAISAKQGSYCIIHAAIGVNAGPNPETQGAGELGGKGGGRYFNRIWETNNMPHTQDPAARSKVWRKVDHELQLSKKGLLGWTN